MRHPHRASIPVSLHSSRSVIKQSRPFASLPLFSTLPPSSSAVSSICAVSCPHGLICRRRSSFIPRHCPSRPLPALFPPHHSPSTLSIHSSLHPFPSLFPLLERPLPQDQDSSRPFSLCSIPSACSRSLFRIPFPLYMTSFALYLYLSGLGRRDGCTCLKPLLASGMQAFC